MSMSGTSALSWVRKRLTIGNILIAAILVWALPRLAPHLGAVLGFRSEGELLPSWSVATLDGRPVSSDDLRGRVVLVNVWATWCLPCRAEMPLLESMWTRHRDDGLVLLGFSVDRTGPESVRRFLEERGITYPVAIVGADVERAFGGIPGVPASFLLDREGKVLHRVVGPLAPVSLELEVRRLLKSH